MSLAQGNNTPTRPRIEPGSPDPESDALTTRPVRPHPHHFDDQFSIRGCNISTSVLVVIFCFLYNLIVFDRCCCV